MVGLVLLVFDGCRYHFDALERTNSSDNDGNPMRSDGSMADARVADSMQVNRLSPRAVARVAGQQINDASVFATRKCDVSRWHVPGGRCCSELDFARNSQESHYSDAAGCQLHTFA